MVRLCILISLAWGGASRAGEAPFFWPLRLEPALSSTFGESRATAFHAGMDVKTWGKTGYEVQALADGHIWRVRTSPWGYGRSIYQKLSDGRIVVYAHLQRFAPQVAARVSAAQRQRGYYTVDLYFKEGEIPVEGGQLIAWSGQSGAGPAHLHLELRDGDNVPINPLLHGFAIADSIAPTLQRVAITPYGNGQVEGGYDPFSLGLRWRPGTGEFAAAQAVQVRGWVGISALMHDRADAAPNKLAPYRVVLRVDGREVFAANYDRVGYGDMHQVGLDRSRLAYPGGVGRFYNLCRLPGNRLGFYAGRGDGLLNAGKGELGKGLHEAVVVAVDVNGNESKARFSLLVDAPPRIARARIAAREDGLYLEAELFDEDDPIVEVELSSSRDGEKWREVDRRQSRLGGLKWRIHRGASLWRIRALDPAGVEAFAICRLPNGEEDLAAVFAVERRPHADFVELVLRFEQVPSAAPRIVVGKDVLDPRQTALREYRIAVPLKPGAGAQVPVSLRVRGAGEREVILDRQLVRPGVAADLVYAEGAVELGFAATSAYVPFFPQVEPFEPELPKHLVTAGVAFALGPEFSFDRKVQLNFSYAGGALPPEKLGLYQEVGAGKWALVGNELDEAGRQVGAALRRFGRFALLADLVAPRIDDLQPAQGSVVGVRPKVRFFLVDEGAGIGREEDITVELDGQLLVAEYDPDADLVRGLLWEDLAPGPHRLVVRVRDASGNEAEALSAFEVR